MSEASLALQSLSQPTRLAAFRLLVRTGSGGLAAGEVATRLGVVQNTMSAHLSQLLDAGLVTARRQGRHVRYAADMGSTRALLSFLLEDCCGGKPELCRPVLDLVACPC